MRSPFARAPLPDRLGRQLVGPAAPDTLDFTDRLSAISAENMLRTPADLPRHQDMPGRMKYSESAVDHPLVLFAAAGEQDLSQGTPSFNQHFALTPPP